MKLFKRLSKKQPAGRGNRPSSSSVNSYKYYKNLQDPGRNTTDNKDVVRRADSLKYKLRHVPFYLAVAVIVGCVLWSMTLSSKPKIVIVNENDVSVAPFLRENTDYQQIAGKSFDNSLFSKTKITVNTNKLAEEIRHNLPEATDVTVALPLVGRNPVVYIRVAEPKLVLRTDGKGVFIVDETGKAVMPAQELSSDSSKLLKAYDASGLDIEVGQSAIPLRYMEFLEEVSILLGESSSSKVTEVVFPSQPSEFRITPGKSKYYIKFAIDQDSREQVGRYMAWRKRIYGKGNEPTTYVDVRVPERVYVK